MAVSPPYNAWQSGMNHLLGAVVPKQLAVLGAKVEKRVNPHYKPEKTIAFNQWINELRLKMNTQEGNPIYRVTTILHHPITLEESEHISLECQKIRAYFASLTLGKIPIKQASDEEKRTITELFQCVLQENYKIVDSKQTTHINLPHNISPLLFPFLEDALGRLMTKCEDIKNIMIFYEDGDQDCVKGEHLEELSLIGRYKKQIDTLIQYNKTTGRYELNIPKDTTKKNSLYQKAILEYSSDNPRKILTLRVLDYDGTIIEQAALLNGQPWALPQEER